MNALSEIQYGHVADSYEERESILRILPTYNATLKDNMFYMQIYTNKHDSKQISLRKSDVDKIINALNAIRDNKTYIGKEPQS